MESLTSPELLSALPEITDKPEDTPRPAGRERRLLPMGLLAFTLTSGVITPIMGFREPLAEARDMTALIEERRSENRPSLLSSTPPYEALQISEAEAANRARLELLARKYVSQKLSTEEEARLAIVSERVRRLIPRVTVEDFEVLANILEDAEQIELRDIERRRRLGIE